MVRLFVSIWLVLAVAAPMTAVARSGPDGFAPIVRRVLPAVVNISVLETQAAAPDDEFAAMPPEIQRLFRNQMRRNRRQSQGAGSGFVIDAAGYIVTNNHVVGNADRITVSLNDGTDLPARVIGTDPLTDIALIKVDAASALPFVELGDSHNVDVGDWVLAAGNPFGLGGSVTAGIVSARGRNIGEGPFDDFIQLDAPINPGNSGGPVFDETGQVVGMNTAIVSPSGGSVGIGFAMPAEIIRRVTDELRRNGRIDRGWLGVSVEDVEAGGVRGAGVVGVDRNSPAARAGVRPGDVVVSVDGNAVETRNDLIRAVSAAPPGSSVRLHLQRGSRELDVGVAVGRRPAGGAG